MALGDESGRLELDAALARSLRLWFEFPSGAVLEAAGFDAPGGGGLVAGRVAGVPPVIVRRGDFECSATSATDC